MSAAAASELAELAFEAGASELAELAFEAGASELAELAFEARTSEPVELASETGVLVLFITLDDETTLLCIGLFKTPVESWMVVELIIPDKTFCWSEIVTPVIIKSGF
ncbi:hypothetical protein G9406_10395 [Weissella paramesenteroides]|uniref:hypothetical protein n=1 Tax=Weissella paramesenteroides TaxID=1249 RepID=UPI002402DB79|nr:hypothetical protein [Weissella paramesenteroides]MDF8367971.1 hypothetical protein [Weissella paramesenteroides]